MEDVIASLPESTTTDSQSLLRHTLHNKLDLVLSARKQYPHHAWLASYFLREALRVNGLTSDAVEELEFCLAEFETG